MGQEIRAVDEWVRNLCFRMSGKFYPTKVANDTGLPLHDVFKRLLRLVEDEALVLQWEVRCPTYECSRNIQVLDKLPDELGYFAKCNGICQRECTIELDMIFPVFRLNQDYRDEIRKSEFKKKSQSVHKSDTRSKKYPENGISIQGLLNDKDTIEFLMGMKSQQPPSPIVINQYYLNQGSGEMNVNSKNRKMGDVDARNAKGNFAFQSDDVKQTYTETVSGPSEDLFKALFEEISQKISDPEERQDALDDAQKLQEAAESGNKDRMKKFFNRLPGFIQTASAAVGIAQAFGIPVPTINP